MDLITKKPTLAVSEEQFYVPDNQVMYVRCKLCTWTRLISWRIVKWVRVMLWQPPGKQWIREGEE